MSRKPKKEKHIYLASQENNEPFESLKSKLANRQKLAEAEGVRLSSRHLEALPLSDDGKTPRFVDDWKKTR